MASAFSGFTIHQDSTENANAIRRNKVREDAQSKMPAVKRSALGVITNNTRVQPTRAAKQTAGNENILTFGNNENVPLKSSKSAFPKPATFGSSQNFTIHIDESSQSSFSTQQPILSQPQVHTRVPLSTIVNIESNDVFRDLPGSPDSPMVLDTSIDARCPLTTEQERQNRILNVPDYTDDIYRHLREMELRHRAKPTYMKKQPDITNSMRCILVDWLVEVAGEYKLHRETLCLAVNYIDRFLSHMSVLRGKLQLVGAASMFLAAKFEEIYPPEVGEFVYITDDTYTKKQVLRMEHLILKVLSFDVAVPTVNCFVERFVMNDGADAKTKSLAMYLSELTLVDSDIYLKYTPSSIAAASMCIANHTLGREPWSSHMERVSGYAINDMDELLRELHKTFLNAPNHPQQAVRQKYQQDEFHAVSTLCPPTSLPQ